MLYLDLALWSVVLWSVVCGCCSSCCYVGVQLRSNGSLPSQPLPVAKGSLCEFFTLKLVGCRLSVFMVYWFYHGSN